MVRPSHSHTLSLSHTHTHTHSHINGQTLEHLTHINKSCLWHTHCTSFTIIHSISSRIISIKQPRLFCTRFKLVPAQRLSLLSPLRFTFVPTSSSQQSSLFPLLQQSTYKTALFPSSVLVLHFIPPPSIHLHSLSVLFPPRTSAESRRCDGVGMLIDFSRVRPQTPPSLAQMPSESWLYCSTAVEHNGWV